MQSYLVKTPKLVQRIFPKRVWAFPANTKAIYLTFDDGPIPEVTPWVVSLLKEHNAKATFFCIGYNVRKHPTIFKSIISEGHAIGNHTFHHLNGSNTKTKDYVTDVIQAEEILSSTVDTISNTDCKSNIVNRKSLFRPPFGRLKGKQARKLQKMGYTVVMWDVLSADFDPTISEEKCLQNVLENVQAGSIVVFHDSLKAEKKLRYVLPKVLDYIAEKGWKCESIDSEKIQNLKP